MCSVAQEISTYFTLTRDANYMYIDIYLRKYGIQMHKSFTTPVLIQPFKTKFIWMHGDNITCVRDGELACRQQTGRRETNS